MEWDLCLQVDSRQLRGTPYSTNPSPSTTSTPVPILVRWYPTPRNAYKLNFDGSKKSTYTTAGSIARNSDGNQVSACTHQLGNTTIHLDEAMALHKYFQESLKLNITNLLIEGDNLLLIKGTWSIL